ncbi:MAG: phenylalanine--tRNA ligase subunit beta [Flavobacteriaceae bacterium]|nr:phenylalanine--tRNA ligase subunit beta [Flavobacteriaceae bacterium]
MKISYNWIKQFLKIDLHHDEVAEILTDLGLEVEGISVYESVKGGLAGVVVGEVTACDQHPNADRLKLTQVDLGGVQVPIVCGAPNVAKGQKVAVASVGTSLYDASGKAFEIKKSKIRGELSQGMICAEDELGLGDAHEGIMVLDPDLENGTPCSQVFDIETDRVFEIGLTPNRADAISHMGVARDLRAYFLYKNISHKWYSPPTDRFNIIASDKKFSVAVEDVKKAPKYVGVNIYGLKIGPSPIWLQNRLKALGIAPKNNVVDITNYVLHDLGQPLHAFDLNKIEEGIIVKTVKKNTSFTTLDGVKRNLDEEDLMICDHEKPLCLAGIYGGLDSGVSENTESIFLESAYFDPVSIRKTAKRHGLNTDASFRFERGIDPEITTHALKLAANLITEIAGGTVEGEIHEIIQDIPEKSKFMLHYDLISNTVGQEISKDVISMILNGLEIDIISSTEEAILVEIPLYRVDVTRPADVIEEILRVYGYNNIATSKVLQSNVPEFNPFDDHQVAEKISNQLVGLGFNEIMNNSITTPQYEGISQSIKSIEVVNIINPLGKELSQMRTSLLPGVLGVIAFNLNRQSKSLKLFELGKIYSHDKNNGVQTGFGEEKHIALALTGPVYEEHWDTNHPPQTFYYFKGIIEAILPNSSGQLWEESQSKKDIFSDGLQYTLAGKELLNFGYVKREILSQFEVNQEVLYAEFNFNEMAHAIRNNNIKFTETPKFPGVRRDFALLLNSDVSFDSLKSLALSIEKKILKKVALFDVYEGDKLPEGKKSYGVSFYFQDHKKTLTDQYVDKVMGKLQKQFEKELGAKLR